MNTAHAAARGNSNVLSREEGSILFLAVVVLTLLMSVVSSTVSLSVTDAKSVVDTEDMQQALFLAEAGIEAAKYELAEETDPDGDGSGNKTVNAGDTSFTVAAIETEPGVWQLTSTGLSGARARVLQVIVEKKSTTKFPGGAWSMLGGFDKTKFELKKESNFIMDGGNAPALSVSSADAEAYFAEKFAEAIEKGHLPTENFTGGISNKYKWKKNHEYDLPIAQGQNYDPGLEDLSVMYEAIVDAINNNLLPTATVSPDAADDDVDELILGTEDAPVTVYIPDKIHNHDLSISGYGTLIVNELELHESSLDWTGNVIVIGSAEGGKKAKLKVKEGSLTLNGNLVVLGETGVDDEGAEEAEFKIEEDAVVNIVGSVFIGSNFNTEKAKKAKFEVKKDGVFNLTGVLTMVGSKLEAKFSEDAVTNITGMWQMSMPVDTEKQEMKVELKSDVTIYKDDDAISTAIEAWEQLGVDLGTQLVDTIVDTDDLTVRHWHAVPY